MSRGIVLFAFKGDNYYKMAYNMAVSIKATSDLQVALVHDLHKKQIWPMPKDRWTIFDKMIALKPEHADAGQIKCHLYEYLPYEENLYLDVDGCALKDLTPLMDELCSLEGYVYADVHGVGGKEDIIDYSIWASNQTIWDYFELGEESKYPAIQSSYMFIRKNDESKPFFDKVAENYDKGFPKDKLTHRWGSSIPDELIYSGTMAQFNLVPHGGKPIFFGWKLKETARQVQDKFYLLAMYGGRGLVKLKYRELYDRTIMGASRKLKRTWTYKEHGLMKGKHANG